VNVCPWSAVRFITFDLDHVAEAFDPQTVDDDISQLTAAIRTKDFTVILFQYKTHLIA